MSLFNVYRGFPVFHVWRCVSASFNSPLIFLYRLHFLQLPPVAPCLQVTAPLFAVLRCHVPCQGDNAHPHRGLFGMLLCTLQIHTKPDIYISVTFFGFSTISRCPHNWAERRDWRQRGCKLPKIHPQFGGTDVASWLWLEFFWGANKMTKHP